MNQFTGHQSVGDQFVDRGITTHASQAAPDLLQWELTTREALRGIAGPASALNAYRKALHLALRLFANPPPGRLDDCTAALVVSCHNLADFEIRREAQEEQETQEAQEAAVRYLCIAHEAVISLLLKTSHDSYMRQIALRHSRETHMALLSYVASHGAHPLITSVLRQACFAVSAGELLPH